MFLILLISFDFVSLFSFSFSFSPHGTEDAEGGWLLVMRP
jgi:hypothetical protein